MASPSRTRPARIRRPRPGHCVPGSAFSLDVRIRFTMPAAVEPGTLAVVERELRVVRPWPPGYPSDAFSASRPNADGSSSARAAKPPVRDATYYLDGRMPIDLVSQLSQDTMAFLSEVSRRIAATVRDGRGTSSPRPATHAGAGRPVNSSYRSSASSTREPVASVFPVARDVPSFAGFDGRDGVVGRLDSDFVRTAGVVFLAPLLDVGLEISGARGESVAVVLVDDGA